MSKQIRIIIFLSIVLTIPFFSCSDLIEDDIEDEFINLLAPADSFVTANLTHTFWWDFLEGAEHYNLQIVQGSFSSVTSFLLDTIVSDNRFEFTLYPGEFQWSVRGLNNGSETSFTTFDLVIDSSLDISNQTIVLNSPTDLTITNNTSVTFNWNSLINADDYLLEVHEGTFSGSIVFGPELINTTSYTVSLPEGTLVWGVQGRNNTSNSSTSFSTRTIIIDTTAPNAPTLLSPLDNATLNNTVNTFSWTQDANSGTDLTDNIFFYSDAGGATLIKSVQVTTPTTHQDSLGTGTFYWNVRSTDAAGNIGQASTIRRVVIN